MSQFHLIAPSGYCINQDAAQRGVQRLLESGHQVENQTIIPRRQQRFAGTEAQRLNDINSLVSLKGKDRIVLAVRGGYGASRLLESIDWQGLAQRQQQDPLLICGHSDFTVIQLGLLALHNVITFSGPMLAGNFGAPELDAFTMEHFLRVSPRLCWAALAALPPMTMTRATRWKRWSISFAPGWTFPSSPGWISAMSSKPSLLRWGRTPG